MLIYPVMEQQERSLVFTAAVGLIILAIIVGSIYYLVKFIQSRVSSNTQTAITEQQSSPNPQENTTNQQLSPAASQNSQNEAQGTPSDKKVYKTENFQFTYPNNWGLLSCNNSSSIELDPTNPADSQITCDSATKPVTVVVGNISGCEGDAAKVGNVDVIKSVKTEEGYTKYQWCTKTTPVLNISHRVSNGGEPATSTNDFSAQIEQIISNLSFTNGS